jgi:hypothetical protein
MSRKIWTLPIHDIEDGVDELRYDVSYIVWYTPKVFMIPLEMDISYV